MQKRVKRSLAFLTLALLAGVVLAQSYTDVSSPTYWGKTGAKALTDALDANFALIENGITKASLGPTVGTITYSSSRSYTNVTDNDVWYFQGQEENDSNETYTVWRWHYVLADVSSNSEDTVVRLDIPIAGTQTNVLQLDATELEVIGIALKAGTVYVTDLNASDDISVGDDLTVTGAVTVTETSTFESRNMVLSENNTGGSLMIQRGIVTMSSGTNYLTFSPVFTELPYVTLTQSNSTVATATNAVMASPSATNYCFVAGEASGTYFWTAVGTGF
jgi:hypothetical protein